jgi:hypothetical protein
MGGTVGVPMGDSGGITTRGRHQLPYQQPGRTRARTGCEHTSLRSFPQGPAPKPAARLTSGAATGGDGERWVGISLSPHRAPQGRAQGRVQPQQHVLQRRPRLSPDLTAACGQRCSGSGARRPPTGRAWRCALLGSLEGDNFAACAQSPCACIPARTSKASCWPSPPANASRRAGC